jgi:hypothetical protein
MANESGQWAGGGRSHPRTCLRPDFPGDGNLAANYLKFAGNAPIGPEFLADFTGTYPQFPKQHGRD